MATAGPTSKTAVVTASATRPRATLAEATRRTAGEIADVAEAVADPDDVETVVDLSFRDFGESTEVVFTQGPFKTQARRVLHRDGWTDGFNKLEALLSSRI